MPDKNVNKEKLESFGPHPEDADLRGLSWDELKYLKDRGRLTAAQQARAGFHPNREGGDFPPGETPDYAYGDEFAEHRRRQLEQQGLGDQPPLETDLAPTSSSPEDDEGEEGESEPYEGWRKAELQAEVDERNESRPEDDQLQRNGTVAELKLILMADDEANAEDDEE